jgi:type I restriction enzyme, R subunit
MNEADTCRTYILPKLKTSGWEDDYFTEQMVLTPGRIVPIGDRHTRKEEELSLRTLLPSILAKALKGEL